MDTAYQLDTDPLKPKYAWKHPRMGDHVQKKDVGGGLILIYVVTIFHRGNFR